MRPAFSAAVLVILTACSSAGVGETDQTTTALPDTSTTILDTLSSSTSPGEPRDRVPPELLADAAQKLGVEEEQVAVLSLEEVTFDDSSLGCPEPGRVYAQVVTTGSVVVVGSTRETLEYHLADGAERFVVCAQGVGKFIPPRGPIADS